MIPVFIWMRKSGTVWICYGTAALHPCCRSSLIQKDIVSIILTVVEKIVKRKPRGTTEAR